MASLLPEQQEFSIEADPEAFKPAAGAGAAAEHPG